MRERRCTIALGRPLVPLALPDNEGDELERWTHRQKTAQALALRAGIVLRAAAAKSNTEIATQLGVTGATVGKWRQRFVRRRSEGLLDEPKPGCHGRSVLLRWRRSSSPST